MEKPEKTIFKKERVFIQIEVESKEKRDAYKAKAEKAGVDLSELVRNFLEGVEVVERDPHRENTLIKSRGWFKSEIQKIGVNVNQIAHHCNTWKNESDTAWILACLGKISFEMAKLEHRCKELFSKSYE